MVGPTRQAFKPIRADQTNVLGRFDRTGADVGRLQQKSVGGGHRHAAAADCDAGTADRHAGTTDRHADAGADRYTRGDGHAGTANSDACPDTEGEHSVGLESSRQ
jgi:hypothetical protein